MSSPESGAGPHVWRAVNAHRVDFIAFMSAPVSRLARRGVAVEWICCNHVFPGFKSAHFRSVQRMYRIFRIKNNAASKYCAICAKPGRFVCDWPTKLPDSLNNRILVLCGFWRRNQYFYFCNLMWQVGNSICWPPQSSKCQNWTSELPHLHKRQKFRIVCRVLEHHLSRLERFLGKQFSFLYLYFVGRPHLVVRFVEHQDWRLHLPDRIEVKWKWLLPLRALTAVTGEGISLDGSTFCIHQNRTVDRTLAPVECFVCATV